MQVDAELIVLPYDSQKNRSLAQRLVEELRSDSWNRLRAAVAFGKTSGSYEEILDALEDFCGRGGQLDITFSADRFGRNQYASDEAAVQALLDSVGHFAEARVHLYSESGNRTFHPKLYLFSNEKEALLIVGSSNWSEGGFFNNVEVNVVMTMDLTDDETRNTYETLCEYFSRFWQE